MVKMDLMTSDEWRRGERGRAVGSMVRRGQEETPAGEAPEGACGNVLKESKKDFCWEVLMKRRKPAGEGGRSQPGMQPQVPPRPRLTFS